MDFFKSVFADDPSPEQTSDADDDHLHDDHHDAGSPPAEDPGSNSTSAWSFGGLIKTLATKSETVIQTYRRDLEEFGSGLKMETAVIRDVASRAVKDLPGSLEAGASVAQGSLESVGQAIDDIGTSVWKSTAEIITQGRDTLLAGDDDSDESSSNADGNSKQLIGGPGSDSKPYNRFEAQLRAIQSSASTYLDEPEDLGNFEQWKLGFALEEKSEEIEDLINENGEISEIYDNFVPVKVDRESFWLRYFYKVLKLKEVEDARVKLVKRAISGEEEDLSWDFDEEDEDEAEEVGAKAEAVRKDDVVEHNEKSSDIVEQESATVSDNTDKPEAPKIEEKVVAPQVKAGESSDSAKESDLSIVSRPEEEDLEWDEIEDVGSDDDIRAEDSSESSSKAYLRKRLSNAAEEEEDLTWDIEEDEEDDDEEEDGKRKS